MNQQQVDAVDAELVEPLAGGAARFLVLLDLGDQEGPSPLDREARRASPTCAWFS